MSARYRIIKDDRYRIGITFKVQKRTWYWPFWCEVDEYSGKRGFDSCNSFYTVEKAIEAIEKYRNPESKVVYYL